MKKVIFTSAILLASLAAGAQGLANVWNGFYNQVSPVITTDVQCSWVDAAGNLYTAGMQQSDVDADIATANVTTLGNSGSNYFYFCKYNSSGVLQFAKQLNSSSVNTTDMAGGIVSDASGNIYVTGHFTGTVDFDPGAGTSAKTSTSGGSGFLAKYSSTGALLWVQNFGNIYTYPQDIALNPVNGNVWIGGYLIANSSIGYADMDPGAGTASNFGNSNGSVGFYCAYSAAAGSYIANTNYAICSTTLNYDCSVNAICFDGTTSNIYLTGSFRGTIYPDNSTSGGPPITTSATKAMFTIRQDIVNTNVNASYDYFDGSPVNEGTDIAVDASGNIFTAGYASTYGGRLWKYNSSMVSQWVKTAGTRLNGVDADNSGNSYVTGTPPGGGIFVQKYNSAGTAQFGTGYSIVEANADAKEIHVSGGDIYLGGTFYNTANFGFDYDVISLAGETSSSVFWAKYQVDNTAPDVTLTTPVSSPTNQDPVPVTITFSEPVNGFNPNPGDPNNATLGNVVQVNATTFTADLIPSVSSGQIDYTVINGLCTDNHNNYNNSSNTLIIDYDAVAPTVSVSSTAPDPTNMSPIPVTFTFSENVSGFTAGDIVVANGTASNFISVSGSIYTADITPASGGNVSVQVNGNAAQDGASNGNTASNIFSIVYDDVHPAVVIMSTAPDPTSTSPIPVTFTFSENVSGFTVGDIAVTNGTASNFVAVSGTVYTADILPSAQGLVSVDVPAAVCADGATNPNDAATQFSITYQLTTGISGPAGIQPFTVFPNPCTGSFTVRLPGGWTAGTVSVYDVTGRMCFSAGTVTGDHVTLQTGLPAGCYSVEIVSPQSRTILPLIIDQH